MYTAETRHPKTHQTAQKSTNQGWLLVRRVLLRCGIFVSPLWHPNLWSRTSYAASDRYCGEQCVMRRRRNDVAVWGAVFPKRRSTDGASGREGGGAPERHHSLCLIHTTDGAHGRGVLRRWDAPKFRLIYCSNWERVWRMDANRVALEFQKLEKLFQWQTIASKAPKIMPKSSLYFTHR